MNAEQVDQQRQEPGEVWGYRARSIDRLVPVRVVRHGTKKPARVLVHFEDPELEGKEEWVPPVRLKVPWQQADAFHAEEDRWNAVYDQSPPRDTCETAATETVFEQLVEDEVAQLHWKDHHLRIRDLAVLSGGSGIPAETFANDPVAFKDVDDLIAPWPLALMVAQAMARRDPEPVLAAVAKEEREYQHAAIHGKYYAGAGRRSSWSISAEHVQEWDEEYDGRPKRDLLREWCGADAVSRWDELEALRPEIKRVGDIAEQAIGTLRALGHDTEADDLAAKLGQTLGTLRGSGGD